MSSQTGFPPDEVAFDVRITVPTSDLPEAIEKLDSLFDTVPEWGVVFLDGSEAQLQDD